jgi:urease gamma subunit
MLMLIHLFGGSYTALNYVADLITVLGAFYAGYRFFESRQIKRQEKKDKKEKEELIATVNTVVDASVIKLMTSVDSLVEKSVKEELAEVNDKIKNHGEMLHRVEHEVTFNDGSSMKDSQKRTEALLNKMAIAVDAVHDTQIRREQDQKAQSETLEKIDKRGEANANAINRVSNTLAGHLGAHEGLPGENN